MDPDKIILATGNAASIESKSNISTSAGLIGAKFTKDSIGFATQIIEQNTVTGLNAVLMNG
jgi:hypothetical protein